MRALVWLVCLGPLVAKADTFAEWEARYQFDCNGPFAQFSPPEVEKLAGGMTLEHTGGTVKLRRDVARKQVIFGVLAGIKDLEPETKALLERFLAAFEKADVDAILVGGDTSSEPDGLDSILGFLASATHRPILVIAGNMERGAALAYSILKVRASGAKHLLNLGLIRRVDLAGVDVVSLSGYHDKAWLHLAAGCVYGEKNLDEAERAIAASDDPVLLLTHGPPRMKGPWAIDYVPGADNVGDPRLTALITRAHVAFGVSGHILEAGGKATDLTGHPLASRRPWPSLFLNPGSANPLPWRQNDGSTAFGLAAVLTIEGHKASYEVLRGEKPSK